MSLSTRYKQCVFGKMNTGWVSIKTDILPAGVDFRYQSHTHVRGDICQLKLGEAITTKYDLVITMVQRLTCGMHTSRP
jgi:hypothetical protein